MKNLISNLFKKKEPNELVNSNSPKKKLTGFKSILEKFFKKQLGNKVKGEDVIGVEISAKEIILAQVSQGDSSKWNLDKLYIHPVEGLPIDANIADYKDKISEQLKIILETKASNQHFSMVSTQPILFKANSPIATS